MGDRADSLEQNGAARPSDTSAETQKRIEALERENLQLRLAAANARQKAEAEVAKAKAEAARLSSKEQVLQYEASRHSELNSESEVPHGKDVQRDRTATLPLEPVGFDGKLNRYHFVSRLILERQMLELVFQALLFVPLLIFFLLVLMTYDPLTLVADMHDIIKSRFGLNNIDVTSRQQLYTFMDGFIEATYDHAAVLIDANTLDTIDKKYCFGDKYNHICKLKYWQTEFDPRSKEPTVRFARNKVDVEYPVGEHTTREVDYPYLMLTPLTPLIVQQRAKTEACDGFGNRYASILNNTAFTDAVKVKPGDSCPCIDRHQQKYIKYNDTTGQQYIVYNDTHADPQGIERIYPSNFGTQQCEMWDKTLSLECVDLSGRPKANAPAFCTQTWCYVQRRECEAVGITDVKQSSLFGPDTENLWYSYSKCGSSDVYTLTNRSTEPLARIYHVEYMTPQALLSCRNFEETEEETTWYFIDEEGERRAETYQAQDFEGGKVHYQFVTNTQQLQGNNWIDAGTKSVRIFALLISPQPASVSDILTLVEVEFTVSQVGGWSNEVKQFSISQTLPSWYTKVYIAWTIEILYLLLAMRILYNKKRRAHVYERSGASMWTLALDPLVAVLQMMTLMIMYAVDKAPPHVFDDMIQAFNNNEEKTYFNVIQTIIDYSNKLVKIQQLAFGVILFSLVRMMQLMTFHPRLGVLALTLARGADALLHFFIGFTIWFGAFAFLAHWIFGRRIHEFGTITRAWHTQVAMMTGEYPWQPNQEKDFEFELYIGLFILVMFFTLASFFLAIVVDSYKGVMEHLDETDAENSLFYDSADMLLLTMLVNLRKYPWPHEALERLGVPREIGNILKLNKSWLDHIQTLPPVQLSELRSKESLPSDDVLEAYMRYYFKKHKPCRDTSTNLCASGGTPGELAANGSESPLPRLALVRDMWGDAPRRFHHAPVSAIVSAAII